MTRKQAEAFAALCVLGWGKHLRSPHVQSKRDKQAEYKRLLAKKELWALHGRMPIPSDPDSEPVSIGHVLRAMVGDTQGIEPPTNQEGYLFVEICGRCIEFGAWEYLRTHSDKPAKWFASGFESTAFERGECLRLMRHLADSFEPERL